MSGEADRAVWLAQSDVSRETAVRLDALVALLSRWSRRINLVGRSTLDAIWTRHVADSAQLWPLAPDAARRWVDLGSGAGFPGLVIAALARDVRPALRVTLIESDARKCAFMAEAARAMDVAVTILPSRIEATAPQRADVVSARALAPLPALLPLAARHLAPDGVALFLKGAGAQAELTEAAAAWHTDIRLERSVTDPSGAVIIARGIRRVGCD